MLEPLWPILELPFSGLRPNLAPTLGLIFEDCLGMAFGLDTAIIKEPDLRITGVPGEPFFTSFVKEGSCVRALSSPPSPGLVGVVGLVDPSSLLHFREKGEARIIPLGCVPGGVVFPSWVGVAGWVEPFVRGLVPPVEERPPNLGSLDTMADLMSAFSSIRCQQRHGGALNYAQLSYAVKSIFTASLLGQETVQLFVVL